MDRAYIHLKPISLDALLGYNLLSLKSFVWQFFLKATHMLCVSGMHLEQGN